jgi:hypothetical protein
MIEVGRGKAKMYQKGKGPARPPVWPMAGEGKRQKTQSRGSVGGGEKSGAIYGMGGLQGLLSP